jgi:hypothetical protein
MNPTLERLRDDVRLLTGQFFADQELPDQTIDAAIRDGLARLHNHFPNAETTAAIMHTGYTVDLTALVTDALAILSLVFPWDETNPNLPALPYTMIGRNLAHLHGIEAQVGDQIRITYRPKYCVGELDGASITTLPPEYESALVTASCASLLRMLSLRAAVQAKDKAGIGPGEILGRISVELYDEAVQAIYRLSPVLTNPSWPTLGLL